MFSSGSGIGYAAPSENIPDIRRSSPVLPGQDNQGYTSFQIHKTASLSAQGPPLPAGHLNPINNTNTVGVGSSQLPPKQPYHVPNPSGKMGGFGSEGDVYCQISPFGLGGVTAPNLQSGVLCYSLEESAVELPGQGEDPPISLHELEELLLGNKEEPRKRKQQARSRSPDRDDGPGKKSKIARPRLLQDSERQELSADQRYRARKKAIEGEKDIKLDVLEKQNVRTLALYEVASSDLKKAEKNIAHFQKSKQDTAKKVQDHLLGLVNASVEPRKDKEEWRKEIFSQNGNQAFDSLWEMYMSLKNQHMSTLALLIESAYMKGGDDIGDGVN